MGTSNGDVSEDAAIRRENLRRLCASRGWGATELSTQIGGRYSYWRDMLHGTKSFGEKAARHIEDMAQLPRGWLDDVSASVNAVRDREGTYVVTRWPFSAALYLALRDLPPDALRRCENVLRAICGLPPL